MAHDYSDEEDDFNGFSDHEDNHFEYAIEHENNQHLDLDDEDASETALDSDGELKDHTGYFDDEASESDLDGRWESAFQIDHSLTLQIFHKFTELPLELREMVWKSYCPDLTAKPRLYDFHIIRHTVQFAAHVEDQTAPLRSVLAVHRESRLLGHKYAPNLITLPHGMGVAPCHLQNDIFLFSTNPHHARNNLGFEVLAQIVPGAQNLGIGDPEMVENACVRRLMLAFPDLKHLFLCEESDDVPSLALAWCASGNTKEYHVIHWEDIGGLHDEKVDILTMWPNPDKFPELEEREFDDNTFDEYRFDDEGYRLNRAGERIREHPNAAYPRDEVVATWGDQLKKWREALDDWHTASLRETQEKPDQRGAERSRRVRVLPLTRFVSSSAIERLEALKSWDRPWEEWETEDDDFGGEEEDDDIDSDDSLNDFLAPDDTIEPDDEGDSDSDGSSDHELSLLTHNDHQVIDLVSSEEDDIASPDSTGAAKPSRRGRVITIDSDTENEAPQPSTASPDPRFTRRCRARMALQKSELTAEDLDDLPELYPLQTTHRRRHAPLDDLEDLDDEDDEEEPSRAAPAKRRQAGPASDPDPNADDVDDLEESSQNSGLVPRRARDIFADFDPNTSDVDYDNPPQVANSDLSPRRARDAFANFDPNLSDFDDDDPPQLHRPSARRRRLAELDDLDDEDDDEEALRSPPPKRRRVRPVVESESDDEEQAVGHPRKLESDADDTEASLTAEEEETSSSDDEPAPPPKMSLAKRLRLEAAAARAANMDSEEESDEGGEEDGRGSEEDEDDDLRQVEEDGDESESEIW